MLLGKYHIVIFREGRSGSRNVRLRGWFGFVSCIIVLALVACNVWLWREWLQNRHLEESLANTERRLEDQRRQLSLLGGKLGEVTQDLQRVRNFDSKLRIMMNMEQDPAEVGDDQAGSFAHSYLPMHRQELAARKMQDFLDSLSDAVRLEEVRQQDLLHALRDNRDAISTMPTIWPVVGFVTSGFGARSAPFGGGRRQFHKGLDISNRIGTPITATAQGTVLKAGHDGAYGLSVEINHGGGIVTKYAHMQRFVVQPGQYVKRGEVIGYIGMTGRTTGPHLHYEVILNGVPVNPMRYILE
ncbi:M23 family metallopeptidase [uncultured Desulfovibrio sp.]|uniref:M23 family metallopeptidase n=1 Tax=uncultured Desulfovibrio sp. TaxID=167968 RepID=UPI00260D9EF7|nr:M23 family metallopeptidase [uncultured Desulfovibrio sp.]